jgi:hypothetical protein
MRERWYWGGFCRDFNRAGDSAFQLYDDVIMVGLNSSGDLVRAGDCYPMVGIFVCHGSTFCQEYYHVQQCAAGFYT